MTTVTMETLVALDDDANLSLTETRSSTFIVEPGYRGHRRTRSEYGRGSSGKVAAVEAAKTEGESGQKRMLSKRLSLDPEIAEFPSQQIYRIANEVRRRRTHADDEMLERGRRGTRKTGEEEGSPISSSSSDENLN